MTDIQRQIHCAVQCSNVLDVFWSIVLGLVFGFILSTMLIVTWDCIRGMMIARGWWKF